VSLREVFLAEDEPPIADMIADMIVGAQCGFQVGFIAHDGGTMQKKLLEHCPDLLVTDIRMPVLSGLELIAQAKRLHPNLVCIVLTSYSEFEYAQTALRLGAADYVLKTLLPDSLQEVLRRLSETAFSVPIVPPDARLDAGRRLREHLDAHIQGDFDLIETAARWGYHPRYLSQAFADSTGTTPKRYHTRAKMELIVKLLKANPDLSLKEAAAAVHFDDELYLSKVFKKVVGMGYSEFRRRQD
jgi:two-component system response regulator YesN